MQNKLMDGSPRRTILLALLCVAVVAAGVMIYFKHAAVSAVRKDKAARANYVQDRELATRFKKMSAETMVFSADANEARSSIFLQDAVKHNGIGAPRIFSDPETTSGTLTRIRTHVNFDNAPLKAVVGFMREVDYGKANLALLGAVLDRQDGPDSWNVQLTYLALVRAK